MTMTKSPMSALGVNVGLCFPRNTDATRVASRPSAWSCASTTYQAWCASSFVKKSVVFIGPKPFASKSKEILDRTESLPSREKARVLRAHDMSGLVARNLSGSHSHPGGDHETGGVAAGGPDETIRGNVRR